MAEAAKKFALVTGATGVIGPELVARLLGRGYRVRVLARAAHGRNLVLENVETVIGDVTDTEAVARAVEDVDVVFHLAAKLHINNPDPGLRGEYQRVNVDGTRVVAQASAAAGVKRLVFFSTIAVYGSTRPDEIADENTPTRADSLYGTSKRDAERVVLSTLASDGLPIGVVLRVAGIYGPRIKGNYRQLVRGLQRGWFLPVGDGRNRRTVVYHSDVAEAAILAGEHPAAPGNVFNVTDGEIHTLREILAAICAGLGRGPIRVYLPLAPVRVLARVVDAVVSVMGRGAVLEPMLTKMVEDMAVSGDKIRDVLGFSPRYELPVGWRETIPQLIQE